MTGEAEIVEKASPVTTTRDPSLKSDQGAIITNKTAAGGQHQPSNAAEPEPTTTKKSFGFYAIIVALALTSLLTSLEATITSTALPTITADLGSANLYVWVVNGYYLTQTAFQPFFGQMADIYGRRWPMITSAAIFTLGSGVAGGSKNIQMLIAGRLLQGIGSGGILVLTEIIICDLLPLRERGKYLGMICNILHGHGNLLFVLSMVSILIALAWAGTQYAWSSYQVLVPILLGFAGAAVFLLYESSSYCVNPVMPLYIFANRTSGTTFAVTFLHTLSSISMMYFLPVYFQAVLGASPSRSGVQLLPTILFMIPGAIAGGTLLSKFGRYRPLQHAGLALMVIGFGLLTLLSENSNTGQWVGYQLVGALGTGLALPVLLPAVQAPLADKDTAVSAAAWSFIRTFGFIWGTIISTAVFNNRFDILAPRITDTSISKLLIGGRAYEYGTKIFINSIADPVTAAEVRSVYVDALNVVWYVSLAFSGLGFLLVFLEKEVPLRKELDTKFAIEEKEKKNKSEA
ncbi:unnamed protein product [Penicillium bialowiezense]